MTEEFAPDENITVGHIPTRDPSSDSKEQEIVCITVTGPLSAVNQTIFTLYQLGFAEVGDWSPIQRTATPKQAISVLIRRKRAAQEKQQKRSQSQAKQSGTIE